MMMFEQAREFIYRNARPLDMARWNYLFEKADKQDVIKYLKAYQNSDGGFANALEPDSWNQKSTPMQTWVATRIIKEIDWKDKSDSLITGILGYLVSKAEFNGHQWNGLNAVATNNDSPHAPWWSYTKAQETSYNPTASLIGFMLKYADVNSSAYHLACDLSKEAYDYFKKTFPLESMHETACFIELYEYIKESDIQDLLDLEEFKSLLQHQIKTIITYTTDAWNTDYVCKPSLFICGKKSDFYWDNEDICRFECKFIERTQNADGTWNVTWSWDAFPEQWAMSKNWWKCDIIIRNLAFLKAMEV